MNGKIKTLRSVLFDLFLHLVFIDNFLKIPEALGGVLEDILLFDALPYYFVENDLEAYGDAAPFQVGVVVLPDLFYFGVFLGGFPIHLRLLHQLPFLNYYNQGCIISCGPSTQVNSIAARLQIQSLTLDHAELLHVMHHFLIPKILLHLLAQSVEVPLLWRIEHLLSQSMLILIVHQNCL